MAKLWKKSDTTLHPAVEKYAAGSDYVFDMQLLPFDIAASRAHAKGLSKIGILTEDEFTKVQNGLAALEKDLADGKIAITPEMEDCHTVIENYLTETAGDVGKKIHTGRSRNDQVQTAVRLYMKQNLGVLRTATALLAGRFLDLAEKYAGMPMPGYSHTQQAMLSSVGHYFAAFVESLLDDADHLLQVAGQIDKSPLGSAAGFGTSIPVDRESTAKEMDFGGVQINSLYCQNSRGKFESRYMEALAQIMLTLGRFANDMILFTSKEFDFFAVDESLTTGSSIMPHKHNLDVMEILRGNVSVVIGNQLMIKDIAKNLLSGYHRDGQLMKKPLIESTQIVADSLAVTGVFHSGLTPKQESIRAKIQNDIFTADIANERVIREGIPFRDAYKEAAYMVPEDVDLEKNIASKKGLGAPGNLALGVYRQRLKKMV